MSQGAEEIGNLPLGAATTRKGRASFSLSSGASCAPKKRHQSKELRRNKK